MGPWLDIILQDSCRLCEDHCAVLRRRSVLLNDLTFDTAESKEAKLKALAALGISRAACHAEIDQMSTQLKDLMMASVAVLSSDSSSGSIVELPPDVFMANQ